MLLVLYHNFGILVYKIVYHVLVIEHTVPRKENVFALKQTNFLTVLNVFNVITQNTLISKPFNALTALKIKFMILFKNLVLPVQPRGQYLMARNALCAVMVHIGI